MNDQGIKDTECIDAGVLARAKLDTWKRLDTDLTTVNEICENVLKQESLIKLYRAA